MSPGTEDSDGEVSEGVPDMSYMFNGASSFNIPLNDWLVHRVTDMTKMFER